MTTQAPSAEHTQYLLVKDHIEAQSKDTQERILSLASGLRLMLRDHVGTGHLAFALVGAEMAAGRL